MSSEQDLEGKVKHRGGSDNKDKDEPEVEDNVQLLDDHVEQHDAGDGVLVLLAKIANFEITQNHSREDAVFLLGGSLELDIPKMEETPEVVFDVEEVFEKDHLDDAINGEPELEKEKVDGGLAAGKFLVTGTDFHEFHPDLVGYSVTRLTWLLFLDSSVEEAEGRLQVDLGSFVEHIPDVVRDDKHGGLEKKHKWDPSVVVDVASASRLVGHFGSVWYEIRVLNKAEVMHVTIPTSGELSRRPALDRLSKVLFARNGKRHGDKNERGEPGVQSVDFIVSKLAFLLSEHSDQLVVERGEETQHFWKFGCFEE